MRHSKIDVADDVAEELLSVLVMMVVIWGIVTWLVGARRLNYRCLGGWLEKLREVRNVTRTLLSQIVTALVAVRGFAGELVVIASTVAELEIH